VAAASEDQNGHLPEAQPPADGQAEAEGHDPSAQKLDFAPTEGAKVESCFEGLRAPHDGQAGAFSERVRARCSKEWPHFEQMYS